MNFGYLNAVILLTWFIWAAHTSEQYPVIKCLVNPNSTLNITLDQDPTNVRYVSILKGDKEIAASRGVYGGWNDALSSKYRDRLTLSPGRTNFTVYLEPVLISDKGNYTTAVTLETGHRFKTHWNVALRETVQEPKLKGTFEIIVDKRGDKYHCTCGEFEELGEPRVEFRWNITDEKDHSLLCSSNNSLHCSALWPVSKCQVLIQNWTDEHIGQPAADGGSKDGAGRKKRSTGNTGCVPANKTPRGPTDEATTVSTEVTPVNTSVFVAIPVVICVIIAIAVIVIVYCIWRKKNQDRTMNQIKESQLTVDYSIVDQEAEVSGRGLRDEK